MTYDQIVAGLREATIELSHEGMAVRAGHKLEQDTAAIVERYSWLFSDAALAAVNAYQPDDEIAAEARRRVRAAIMQGLIDRRVAAQDDKLTTFYATQQVTLPDGETLPFFTAQARRSREPDPARREALGDGEAQVMAAAEDLGLELNRQTLDVIRGLGYASYIDFWSHLKGVDYERLLRELTRVRVAAATAYRTAVEPWMRAAGHGFGDTPQWHLSYFRGMPQHDRLFTPERFQEVMEDTFSRIGLDIFAAPTIHLDLEDRPAKNPRASVQVPEAGVEVHLLTRPSGGHADYSAFLHEAGHALHFGLTDPAIGWPLANLGRSMAYAELWSYLFERIGYQPEWIERVAGEDGELVRRVAADVAAMDLMMFIRYVSKLAYELELYAGDPLDAKRGQDLYARFLSEPSGFVYDPRGWQYDRDAAFYSADYLRAWLAEAAVEMQFRHRFGAEWWANPEAGQWLRGQWKHGWRPEAEETVAEMGGKPWSGDALLSLYGERLAGVS